MFQSRLPAFLVSVLFVGGAAIAFLLRPQGPDLPIMSARAPQSAPAMCPWRDPYKDMSAFFPGASRYQTETIALSRHRQAILKRLGPAIPLESNALYANRVFLGDTRVGVILVRRASGQYGAIEVVLAVDENGKVAGVRIQRQREPKEIAQAITSPQWLSGFVGKDADARFLLGEDVSSVPPGAKESANAVARTVRGLLIELSEGIAGTSGHVH